MSVIQSWLYRISALGLVSLLSCGKSNSKPDDQSGIEIGNPSLTVSAEFQLAEGTPVYFPLSKQALLSTVPSEVKWTDLHFPLQNVRYYASYYYYMPTDPLDGAVLWPTQPNESILMMDVLDGDTLIANFEEMDIPSRSYLKEVGVQFQLSNWTFRGNWCSTTANCRAFSIQFPDSLNVDIRYHHSQLERYGSELGVRLPVHFYPEVFLASLDLEALAALTPVDSVIRVAVSPNLLNAFCNSFNGLRYFYQIGRLSKVSGLMDASLTQLDQIGSERVKNGSFIERGRNWTFLTQQLGVADTSFTDSVVKFEIHDAGNKDFSVQWMQEDIELVKDRWYRLRFTAWANRDSTVMLSRVGRFHAPYDNLDANDEDFRVGLSQTPKTFEWEFKAKETNPFGRLEFNLGLFERSLWIRDVSVIQVEE